MKSGLTKRQFEIYSFICRYFAKHLSSPCFREILKFMKTASVEGVQRHVKALEKKGFIKLRRFDDGTGPPRAIQIVAIHDRVKEFVSTQVEQCLLKLSQ